MEVQRDSHPPFLPRRYVAVKTRRIFTGILENGKRRKEEGDLGACTCTDLHGSREQGAH
jgi:hypothetical protein